jgi:hypothetical protein
MFLTDIKTDNLPVPVEDGRLLIADIIDVVVKW